MNHALYEEARLPSTPMSRVEELNLLMLQNSATIPRPVGVEGIRVLDSFGDGIRYENHWDDLGQVPASLSNREVRAWYLSNEMEIPNILDTTKPLEFQAKQSFEIRNELRAGARDLMADQRTADYLRMNEPNFTWDEFITIKSMKYSGDDLWNSIINSSQKSRGSVNEQFNFIGDRPRYD